MLVMRTWLVALGLALSMGPAVAEEAATDKPAAAAEIPDPKVFASDHTFRLGSETIKYKTVASETCAPAPTARACSWAASG